MKLLVAFNLSLIGCLPGLANQQSLAARVHAATVQCISAKPGPAKIKICSDASLCQGSAQSAAEAIQAAQLARATGTDAGKEAAAAGLDFLADAACKRGGW